MVFYQDMNHLTGDVIDAWTSQAEEAYKSAAGKRADSTLRFRLSLEELLLRFRELYGTEEPCEIKGIRRFSGIHFELSQRGAQQNPLDIDPEMSLPYDLLTRLNLKPRYSYRENRGQNVVTIPAPLKPRKNAMLLGVLLGAALAVVTWLLSGLLPEAVLNGYLLPLMTGLFSKLSSVFSALATPLVFCAVVAGICGIGDISSFGKLGGRLLKRMMATYGIAMMAMLVIGLGGAVLPLGGSATLSGTALAAFVGIVLNLVLPED